MSLKLSVNRNIRVWVIAPKQSLVEKQIVCHAFTEKKILITSRNFSLFAERHNVSEVDFISIIITKDNSFSLRELMKLSQYAERRDIPVILFEERRSSENTLNIFIDPFIHKQFSDLEELKVCVDISINSILTYAENRKKILENTYRTLYNIQEQLEKEIKEKEKLEEEIKEKEKLEEENKLSAQALNQVTLDKEILESNIKALEANIEELKYKLDEAGKDKIQGEELENRLSDAFSSLSDLSQDMKADIKRLNWMFYIYIALTIICIIVLFGIWNHVLSNLEELSSMKISNFWVFSAPSFILVGFIGAFIHQISRAQRQLLYLKKYNRKYKVIKYALEGYYAVEDELQKTPDKAQEIFDLIIKVKLGQSIDFDDEEKKAKASEAQDQSIKEDFAKQIIDAIKSIRYKKE